MRTLCSGPHCIGGMTGGDIKGYEVHVYRVFGSKYLRSEIDGKMFPNSDEAQIEIIRKGYGSWYYPRSSTPLPTFANLKSQIKQARFDALYRYFKYLKRKKSPLVMGVLKQLEILASEVGIFHPCAKFFLPK